MNTTTHDPAVVKMAELSRLFDEWMDADGRVRAYERRHDPPTTEPEMIDYVELRVLAEAAKQRYFEAVAR